MGADQGRAEDEKFTDSETNEHPSAEAEKTLEAPTIINKKEDHLLKCKFTGLEKAKLSMQMADAVTNINNLEADMKSAKSQFGSKIDEQKAVVTHCANALTSGYEQRKVEVQHTYDHESGQYTLTRLDTGEVIVERVLSDDEMQMEFVERNIG